MDRHPLITELRYKADSFEWNDVLVFFCREVADEDRNITTKLNSLREEMLVIREKRRNLMDELRSIRGIVVGGKAAEFVSETVRKDNAQIEKLRGIESEMEVRALKKELHVQKICVEDLEQDVLSAFSVMAALPKCKALQERVGEWDWSKMLALYCKNVAADDFEFARRISVLYQEMEIVCGEKLAFIRELEGVPSVAVAAKTAEFLNDKLWKDDKILTKLHNTKILARDCAYQKEEFAERI
ncbi:hypothetical protein Tco_0240625 [Tanacetum coccineum]